MKRAQVVALLLGAFLLGGCGGSSSDGPATATPSDRAWTKAYADTTCADWTDKMSQAQNQTAAADMLGVAWKGDGVSDRHPSKALVTEFKAAVTAECEADSSLGMTRAAATAYISEKATFKP